MATHTRRGVNSEFTINYNAKPLQAALKRLEPHGKKSLDETMYAALLKEVASMQKKLKSLAGPLATVRTPAFPPYGRSTNIHTKVANALKVHRNKKMEFTVHTGDSIAEAAIGVLGQRGGRLSHIVAKGMNPFRYGNLPMLVQSSTRWYAKTGVGNWLTTGMRMRRVHPGFSKTMDYIGQIQKESVKRIEANSKEAIMIAALNAGFSVSGAMAKAESSGGASIVTNTGGTGKRS
jgi:hypothetical protein